jgi:hemerythrin
LFELLNLLADTFNQGNPSRSIIDEALGKLLSYADEHFMDEELLMVQKKIDARLVSMQRMEHKSFIYDVNLMREGLFDEENLLEKAEKLLRFITLWLTYHILGTDMDMAEQLKAISAGVSPEAAYDIQHAKKRDNVTTRLMLDAVLKEWGEAMERCRKLEEELHFLKTGKSIYDVQENKLKILPMDESS